MNLRPGDAGPRVAQLQADLRRAGGQFGPKTEAALVRDQVG